MLATGDCALLDMALVVAAELIFAGGSDSGVLLRTLVGPGGGSSAGGMKSESEGRTVGFENTLDRASAI